jgi:hypothetical protein
MRHSKELYEHGEHDIENQQNINIYQNCGGSKPVPGPGPKPIPGPGPKPIPVKLSKKEVVNWINSVNSALTNQCKNCITDAVLKMWKQADLDKVKTDSIDDQKKIVDALLAFDCEKQCVITPPPPSGLTAAQVNKWVTSAYPGLPAVCYTCIVSSVMKMWTLTDFKKVQAKSASDQHSIVQGLLAFDCPHCQGIPVPPKPTYVTAADAQKFLSSVLVGQSPKCYQCLVSSITKNWTVDNFTKIKAMKKDSQVQVVQALLAFACLKECVVVPSGLTTQEVQQWLNSVFSGANAKCSTCLVQSVQKLWTRDQFTQVKAKAKADQVKIVQGLIAFDCKQQCVVTPPHPSNLAMEIQDWIEKILPHEDKSCYSCMVSHAVKMWDEAEFDKVKAMPLASQQQIGQGLLGLNCQSECSQVHPPPHPGNLAMEIQEWIKNLMPHEDVVCVKCAVSHAVSMWATSNEFDKVKAMPAASQLQLLQGLLAFNCKGCEQHPSPHPANLAMEIQDWAEKMLPHVDKACISCITKHAVKMWNPDELGKVQKMPLATQQQIAEGILGLNCEKECSELTKDSCC